MVAKNAGLRLIVLLVILLSIRTIIFQQPYFGSKEDDKHAIFLQERSNHTILFNFKARARDTSQFPNGPRVTLTTITDTNFLHHIEPMVQRWNGPISLCIFVPGDHFDLVLRQIQWLVSCSNGSLVHDWVSFHFVFPKAMGPNKIFKWNSINENGPNSPCLSYDVPKGETTNIVTYRERLSLDFPINLLRNIAIEGVALDDDRLQFVFPCDIEMIPSPNLSTKFAALIERMDLSDRDQKVAYLLPEFEIKEGVALPTNKTTLLHEMRATKNVVMFHQKTAGMLHVIPSMADWIRTPESDDSNLELLSRIEGPIRGRWEPLFIIRRDFMPHFDERLTWEKRSDKVLLMIKMCYLGIQFRTLNNAFAIHKGIKTPSSLTSSNPSRASIRLIGQILDEYEKRYGVKDGQKCRESNPKQMRDQWAALRKALLSK